MFNNPGKKLRTLAVVIFILLLLLPVLVGILIMVGGFGIDAKLGVSRILIGAAVILTGVFSAWLSSILLYAVGTAIDDIQTIKRIMIRMYKERG